MYIYIHTYIYIKFLDVFWHSVLKSHNTRTTQQICFIVFECPFPNFCRGSSKQNGIKETYNLLVLGSPLYV